MQKEFPEAEVFEIKKTELNSPIIFAGFVGVGPVAINHIIAELEMDEQLILKLSNTLELMPSKQIQYNYHNSSHI